MPVVVATVAGLSISAATFAQSDRGMQPPRNGSSSSNSHTSTVVRAHQFCSGDKLKGMPVYGSDSKKIGDVSNVVFDRFDGSIESVAVDLGLLSKTVAVPFSQFSWATPAGEDARLSIRMTEDQLKALPAFDKDRLKEYTPSGVTVWTNRNDPFPSTQSTAGPVTGTVERIDTIEMSDGDEYTVLVISGGANGSRRVVLGPNWYTRGASYVPFRGAEITVNAYEVQHEGRPLLVATEIRDSQGRTSTYRGNDSKPRWTREDALTPTEYQGRYLLLSNLEGRDVQANAQSCGKIDDVILERSSGQIAFLSIDPDENFLGIADTKRLVPYSLAVIPVDGPAQVDASKEMVVASIETPSDLDTLAASERLTAAYRAFGVEVPRYRSRFQQTPGDTMNRDVMNTAPWTRVGESIRTSGANSRVRVKGATIDSVETRTIGDGVGDVRVARVTADGKTYEVIVAPPAHLAKQRSILTQGERADLVLTPIRLDSREYWIASSYQTKDGNVILWDDAGNPSWKSSR